MVDYPPNSPGYGRVTAQGCATDHGEVAPAENGWEMVLPSAGDSDTGSRI